MDQLDIFFQDKNYDIRKYHDARFMDQKVTPDVLSIIASCILEFVWEGISIEFTTKDIWGSDYANDTIKDIFHKPDVLDEKAQSEYDKFFAQPLRMLWYAGVLSLEKRWWRNIFHIQNRDILYYISIKERNALNFIIKYLFKVLSDSGLWAVFHDFFEENTKEKFILLKNTYEQFIINNTPIKKILEPRRIFTKIINPLAYFYKSKWTQWGGLSKDIIEYDALMYNRKNWRDIKKLKWETREEYELRAIELVRKEADSYNKYTMEKAKKLIRERHARISEVKDEYAAWEATQVHHIFPMHEFPEIKSYAENLILLTPSQHLGKAHPSNSTQYINKDYQLICLLCKSESIEESVELLKDDFYSKDDFITVLNTWTRKENYFATHYSFDAIRWALTRLYHAS